MASQPVLCYTVTGPPPERTLSADELPELPMESNRKRIMTDMKRFMRWISQWKDKGLGLFPSPAKESIRNHEHVKGPRSGGG
jgi:hypothetical protein